MSKVAILLMICAAMPALAIRPKMIHGKDNRIDLNALNSPRMNELSNSIAGMVETKKLRKVGDSFLFENSTLKDYGICSSERFSDEPVLPDCTGFLVGYDILLTAGHCVEKLTDCTERSWVFNYDMKMALSGSVPASNVYGCKRVLARELDSEEYKDYAVIQLDRFADDREPLITRSSGKVEMGAPITMIGHPTGLPMKVTAGAIVRKNDEANYFTSNIDAFGGNSGSPVFNTSGVVEGMLVRGGKDYITPKGSDCMIEMRCSMWDMSSDCLKGEDIYRVTSTNYEKFINTPEYIYEPEILSAVSDSNLALVRDLLSGGADVNSAQYSWSLIHQAVLNQDIKMVRLLVDSGANLNLRESFDGLTPLMIAIQLKDIKVATLLVDSGVDINMTSLFMNENALMMALADEDPQLEMLELAHKLIRLGSNLKVSDRNGHTAVDLANFIGDYDLISAIESRL